MFNWNFEFRDPWFFLLFVLLIPLIFRDVTKKRRKGIEVPTIKSMTSNEGVLFVLFLLKLSKYIILSALIIAMARPRTYTVSENRDETKGVDIILAVDVSYSMLAKDLRPDRLTALKGIAQRFVDKRPNDRIGLVAYAAEALTKVPITLDHDVLKQEIEDLKPTELEPGTAIGEGLSVAVNHLKDSRAKSKIIILMTDGVNTIMNAMPSQVGAELAKNNKIKVYTIGIGTNGYALMPTRTDVFTGDLIFTEAEVMIDELTLRDIADTTGGLYFRATSNDSLESIYNDINKLEKTGVKASKLFFYDEYFRVFLWIAFFTLIVDAILRWIFYKTVL